MTLITAADAAIFDVPDTHVVAYAAPSRGSAELCLWRENAFLFVGDVATQYQHHVSAPAPVTTVTPDGNGQAVASTQSMTPTLSQSPSSGVTVSCAQTRQPGAWDAAYLARAIRAKYSMGRSLAAGG